ncbi:hypothetical protein, partial [Mesorhizobium sp. M7D.F.Ca.US.004.03.1.1]|uniref:hypothetical protein n=1 Tax=Mesorhizobium sp. M7D.F.Ca.US.004.03.1.1 TaxID=2496702 RepID=UPI0019D1A3FF
FGAPAPVSWSSTVVPSGAARTDNGRSRRFSVLSCRQTNSAAPDHQEPRAEFCRLGQQTVVSAALRNVFASLDCYAQPLPARIHFATRTKLAGSRGEKRSQLNSRLQ